MVIVVIYRSEGSIRGYRTRASVLCRDLEGGGDFIDRMG